MPVFQCPACGKALVSGDHWPDQRILCPACGAVAAPNADLNFIPAPGSAWSAASSWSASATTTSPLLPNSAMRGTRTQSTDTVAKQQRSGRLKWISIGAAIAGLPLLIVVALMIAQSRANRQNAVAMADAARKESKEFAPPRVTELPGAHPMPFVASSGPADRHPVTTPTAIVARSSSIASSQPDTERSPTNSPRTLPAPERAAPLPELPVTSRPALQPTPIPAEGGVSDGEVERSIKLAMDYLLSQFDSKRSVLRRTFQDGTARGCGANALSVYALLEAGRALNDERLGPRGELGKALLDGTKTLSNTGGPETYATSLRATCLSLFNRDEDRAALAADVESLIHGEVDGAYEDNTAHRNGSAEWKLEASNRWDNFNSQYGALGVWAGADAGATAPPEYWEAVETHWNGCQCESGQWSDGGPAGPGTLSMTAAGLATLLAVRDFSEASLVEAPIGRPPFRPAIEDALQWWETGDHAVNISETEHWASTLCAIGRVGLVTGFKYFGDNDWFRVLARRAMSRQQPDGSWEKNPIETAYALLFLARGRQPILINKLRFDGYWANRPRDAASLARFASRELQRPMNWQVVDIKRPWEQWIDAPILSIASHKAPRFTDEQIDKLRHYAQAGGMILTQADGGSSEFDAFVGEFAKRLFPQYELSDLPEDHPLYSAAATLQRPVPRLRAVQNGSRILLLYSPTDLAESWQQRNVERSSPQYQLGLNLVAYVSGRMALRNRLDSPFVPAPSFIAPLGRVKVARISYPGNWDPEPWAWTRFGRQLQFETGTGLDSVNVQCKQLSIADAPIAHLTGSTAYQLTDLEETALKAFIEAGGVLLIDDTGGTGAFAAAMRQSFSTWLGVDSLKSITDQNPLVRSSARGMRDISRPAMRPFTTDDGVKSSLPRIASFGKGHVIFCGFDVTSGLLGTHPWGIRGYDPGYAQSLVQNVIFWTLDGQADHTSTIAP